MLPDFGRAKPAENIRWQMSILKYADIAEFKQLGQWSGTDTVISAAIIITATATIDH